MDQQTLNRMRFEGYGDNPSQTEQKLYYLIGSSDFACFYKFVERYVKKEAEFFEITGESDEFFRLLALKRENLSKRYLNYIDSLIQEGEVPARFSRIYSTKDDISERILIEYRHADSRRNLEVEELLNEI